MNTVLIIFTGGTIAMRTDAQGRLVPASSGDELLLAIPELAQTAIVRTQQLCNVASAHLNNDIWLNIRREILTTCADDACAGVVLVQGTDTLEETAFFLAASITPQQLHHKPVVLTGAMRSNDEANGDGRDNLLNAVRIAQAETARNLGVVVSMYGRIHSARYVRKVHTTRTDAFASVGAEPVGSCAADGSVHIAQSRVDTIPPLFFPETQIPLPEIAIVSTHIGVNPEIITFYASSGCAGLVVQGLGAGNVSREIAAAIERVLAQGISVVIATRCHEGSSDAIYGYVGGGQYLVSRGAVMAGDLPAHKARIYLQLLLAQAGATQNPLRIVADGFASFNLTTHG